MTSSKFVEAREIMDDFEICQGSAYNIIKKINQDLKEQGKITIPGKVPRAIYEQMVGGLGLKKDATPPSK